MSEGDVSAILDEDVLRRMWQQTEDFGRKKEIRAHMYRLREERLRDLYTPPDKPHQPHQPDQPSQRSGAKGHEFTASQGHTKSFADQSFQSIKSKEVRDAGSPPRDYSYPVQELKDSSNAGWNVESEDKMTDDGRTHVKAVHAHVAGKYDVDGGSGSFAAVDRQRQTVTEHHDDNASLKRNESASATSAHEHLTRNTDDGGTFSSTVSSSSVSSKIQQVTSSKQEALCHPPTDTTDFSVEQSQRRHHELDQTSRSEHASLKKVNESQNFESSLRSDEGELMSRKVEYPDENTKVIVETRSLPDGTQVTSTRREIRGPVVQTSHSEQHSQQVRSNSRTSRTTQSESNIRQSKEDISHNTFGRKEINQNDRLNKTHQEGKETVQSISEDIRQEGQHSHENIVHHDDFLTNEKSTKDQKETHQHTKEVIEQTSTRKSSVEESHYQTTYKSDFTDKKISSDLSPTHQAWASTLRADTPSTQRGSVRGSSPVSRTFQSSTSSMRSSVSPDKYPRTPSSRGGSPNKFDRQSPPHATDRSNTTEFTNQYRTKHHNRNTSPEQKPSRGHAQSPSPSRQSPIKETYRFIDEETKTSTKYNADAKQTRNNDFSTYARHSSPEMNKKPSSSSPTKSTIKDYAPVSNRVTKHDEKHCVDNYSSSTNYDSYHSTINDDKTYSTTDARSSQSPSKDIKRQPSPPKVSFKSDTIEDRKEVHKSEKSSFKTNEVTSNTSQNVIHARSPSPAKKISRPEDIPKNSFSERGGKSPDKTSITRQSTNPSPNREPSPSKYGTYERKKQHSENVLATSESTRNKFSTTDSSPVREDASPERTPRASTSPVKYREPSPSKYGTYENNKQHSENVVATSESTRNTKCKTDSCPVREDSSPDKRLRASTSPVKYRESSSIKYGTYERNKKHNEDVVDRNTISTTDSSKVRVDYSPKKTPRASTSPVKHPSEDEYSSTSTDFISCERNREEINRKHTTPAHPRQLFTPSSSPTRKPKYAEDAPSTGQSSPTTSVSEIMYFSSPRDGTHPNTEVTDLDDVETFTQIKSEKDIVIAQSDKKTKKFEVIRSPSPTKIPCKSPKATSPEKDSPNKDNVPRKSSLKKPSSDTLLVSPVERPPTTFQVSPSEETKGFIDHKIVKKDKADCPDIGSKIKERPPFTRSETYEERCRKILGMNSNDSLIIEAEKTVSKILEKLPIDNKPSDSTKTSSSISPCPSPQREMSPLNHISSQTKTIQDKKNHDVSEFLSHEKETGEKTIHKSRYVSPPPKPVEKYRTPSRESSPTKLQDIIYDSKNTTTAQTENITKENCEIIDNIKSNTDVRQHTSEKSARFSVSPHRKFTDEPKKSNSRTPSPSKKTETEKPSSKTVRNNSFTNNTLSSTENFISSEKKQQIIDRVHQTLRNISPNRQQPESKRSPSRERSPLNISTHLQDILSVNTNTTEVEMTKQSTEKKSVITKKSDLITTDKLKHTNLNKTTSVPPTKRPSQTTRTESPNKGRSISPKKAVSAPLSPQVDRKPMNQQSVDKSSMSQKFFTKKQTLTEYPSQRKPADKEVIDAQKKNNLIKQNSFSKSSSVKSNVCSKNQSSNINKTVQSKSKMTSSMQVNSDSEDEQVGTNMTRRRSMEKGESRKFHTITHNNKNTATPKPLVDLKITRTVSDTSLKTSKTTQTKLKSKPEINISNFSKTKLSTKQTASTTTRTIHQGSKLRTEKPHSNLANKPKSATTLNNSAEDDDIIIDIQQAKSSRENSPDKICPTPVSFLEETGMPRLPDEVSEPEDEMYRRTHTTIHESESLTGDIIEISEDEEVTTKTISEVDRVTGSDDCLLSVNDKVNKFINKADDLNNTKDKTYRFKETEKITHSDFRGDESDECLMSVSQKVSKFTTNEDSFGVPSKDTPRIPMQQGDHNPQYEDNYTKLSVNDKANLFVKTAEEIISPSRPSQPAPKVERPDLKNVHDSLKSDQCLLSVSDKVNRFVQSAEKFTNETDDLHFSRHIDDETSHKDRKEHKVESYAKETVSSHAKVRDCTSPNLKSNERIPAVKITTLRSSEAVKKAKAMFENIASQQVDQKHEMHFSKGTRLTDIGVFKKSTPTDSTMVLHPSLEDGSPNLTDTESEIDIAPHVRNTKRPLTNGGHELPKNPSQPLSNGFHKSNEKTPDRTSRKSPETLRTKSPERFTKIDSHKYEDAHRREVTSSKSVLSRYQVGQKIELVKEPQQETPKKHVDRQSASAQGPRKSDIEKASDEVHVSSRRGSEKFGVELRRTSVEHPTTEHRRSSAGDPHHQPCIEDIFDLELLEQMLEKVVGYEQRRRIRAQMRLAKKATETEHFVDTNTYTRHSQTNKKTVSDVKSKTKSPDRKTTFKPTLVTAHPDKPSSPSLKKETLLRTEVTEIHTKRSSPERVVTKHEISKTRSPRPEVSSDKKIRQPSPEKKTRHPSPEKKVRQPSPEKKVRQPSPDKKSRTHSPSKTPASPKTKSNRFNEYASAYMRKVGLDEPPKTTRSEMNTTESSSIKVSIVESSTTERKSSHDVIEFGQVTKKDGPVAGPVMQRRAPSPVKNKQIPNDHIHARTPSPDFKRPQNSASKTASHTTEETEKDGPVASSVMQRRAPSPVKKKQIPNDHIHARTPSPDFKRPQNSASKTTSQTTEETKTISFENGKRVMTHKVTTEEKPTWITNNGLKKTLTAETRSFTSKKVDIDRAKYRSTSPSKAITRPTDVITSSYGLGPMDADGRPLFGIKALRNGASNYQVKGTVIRSEYRSSDGGEPAGEVSVTAYSTRPEELARLLDAQAAPEGAVRDALRERARSRHGGLSAITTTKRFGGDTGATIANVHTKEEREALQQFSERRSDKKTVRQSSVKSLTEKFIKNAVDTSKSDKSSYPKAGLILRTSGLRDASSDEAGLVRSDSEHSVSSSVDGQSRTVVREVTSTTRQSHADSRRGAARDAEGAGRQHAAGGKSFLDSNTKVAGVQDILTRMKNADIVIEDGDTSEDAEARALLNKFLGATVLMAGMESYVTEKPAGRVAGRTESKSSRTVTSTSTSAGGGAAGAPGAEGTHDVERIWDETLLRQLLEQCTDYEQRRRIRARLRQVMAEQEACADLVRSVGEAAAEEAGEGGERGESLLLPLLQGLLDGEGDGGGDSLLAGLGASDADVAADVRRALRRLRAALAAGGAAGRHPRRDALLALAERLERGLAAADRLDGCGRQPRALRRRARAARHTVGVTREELDDARRLVDETELDEIKAKSEPQTPVPKPPLESQSFGAEEKVKPPPIAHSISYESAPVARRDAQVVRRAEPVNRDKLLRHSIANGVQGVPELTRDPQLLLPRRPSKENVQPREKVQARESMQSKEIIQPKKNIQQREYVQPAQNLQQREYVQPGQNIQQKEYVQPGQNIQQREYVQPGHNIQQREYVQPRHNIQQIEYVQPGQNIQQRDYIQPGQNIQQREYIQPRENIQPRQNNHLNENNQWRDNFQGRAPMRVSERNGDMAQNRPERIEPGSVGLPPPAAKENIFRRAPLYRPPPPGHNFASAQPSVAAEEAPRPLGRFNSNKRSRMKRANTIDIPKPLSFYRVESDTDDEAPRADRNPADGPTVPSFQPKTDNDRKFLAFIQKNNGETTVPWSPSKAAQTQAQNWNSCFGNIKNAFENQSQDRSRSSSSSSARRFWKTADDQSVDPVKAPNYGPRLSRKSVNDLQELHAHKANNKSAPWVSEGNADVVSASITVTGPNHTNGIVQAPAKPFIEKPIPVNQFSHAPMSAFKPLKKITSPVTAPPHIWSPPSYERDRVPPPPQDLPINNTYVPAKPVLQSPTAAPWVAGHADRPKRVLSLAATKFESNQAKTQPSPTYVSAPPPFKPKSFAPFESQRPPLQPYQNYPVKAIPSQNNLSAPQLVKKFDNIRQNYDDKSQLTHYNPPSIDAQKLQIEFYEKQILEKAKRKPIINGHAKKLPDGIIPQNSPQTYTVTNYTPRQVSTFVPLQQTPDIEKANAHKVDYLPDVVLNEHNQYAYDFVKSPSLQKSESMTKPVYPSTRAGIQNGTNSYPMTPPAIQNGCASPGQGAEPQYEPISPGEYDPTEYQTVTRVMRGPVSQQATIKSGVTTRNGEALRGTAAAKSLKGVLQKFSSPKNEVLDQIERKKREQRAPGDRFQVPPPQPPPQPHRMENRPMFNQPVNTFQHNYGAPPTPPHDPRPASKSVPVIKYNNVPMSPPVRPQPDRAFDYRIRSGGATAYSNESLDMSSKPPSPAVAKFKAASPHSQCSTTPSPSPSALSKSESWHQLVERQAASSPRSSPRRVVSRAKSMHLLSVPKLFEGGIAQDQLHEKRRTVEAYFSGQASPQALSKSDSQRTVSETASPVGTQSPTPARAKGSILRTKTSEKRAFSLGRSRTMPTINDMKLLDESNADDAFENLLKETFS